MSENNTEQKQALSEEEKIEFLKTMFSTLDIDQKMIFTQWCHEECEKGGTELVGRKFQEVNDKFNGFIAKVSDNISKGAKFIYEKGNEAFETREEDAIKNNTSEELDKDDSPSFFS
jgi:hypothetical protein